MLLTPQNLTLRCEALGLCIASVAAYGLTDGSWTMFALLILAPDVFMLGYVAGPRVGAVTYNIGHTLLVPLALIGAGAIFGHDTLLHVGLIWAAHIGIDRAVGYGLKYGSRFRETHLDRV